MLGMCLGEVSALDVQIQKLRLVVNGAITVYEGQGLDIPRLLMEQNRTDLLVVMDALVTALYWIQEMLPVAE